jgi:hypothetical protein
MTQWGDNLKSRRSLLTGMGVAAAGLAVVAATADAEESSAGFHPARHDGDAWMDELSGNHRVFIDSATALGGAEALLFANNILNAHTSAYDGKESDYAMIVCLRHFSTVFAFSDEVWKKYGEDFNSVVQFPDPLSGNAPDVNLMQATDRPMLPNMEITIDSLVPRGIRFAICNNATHWFSNFLASAGHGDANDIYNELVASAIPNSRFVSAGVMAVTRSQEYGYSLLYAG